MYKDIRWAGIISFKFFLLPKVQFGTVCTKELTFKNTQNSHNFMKQELTKGKLNGSLGVEG